MSQPMHVAEHEIEPMRGLPQLPPEGETILWQGSPSWPSFARRVFHTRKVAVYFALLLAWRAASAASSSTPIVEAAASFGALLAVALVGLGLLLGLGWVNSRTTVYTITNRRVVLRIGVAFTLAVNLPFRSLEAAALKTHADGTGDLTLQVSGADQVGYLALWPHVRPWRFGEELQPMLRSIPQPRAVAELLARAVGSTSSRAASSPIPAPAREPTRTPAGAAAASF